MVRDNIKTFQEIPNVGKATEADFLLLGLQRPQDLAEQDPYKMYHDLCRLTQQRHDPCVIDVFIASVEFMRGSPAKKWWEYTKQRKAELQTMATGADHR